MRKAQIALYKYDELESAVKERVLHWFCADYPPYGWWRDIFEDAKTVGLEIIGFDLRYPGSTGKFINSGIECAHLIRENHGESCGTYKTAIKYLDKYHKLIQQGHDPDNDFKEFEDIDREFLDDILRDYRALLKKEYEHLVSIENLEETIRAQEFEFTRQGHMNN